MPSPKAGEKKPNLKSTKQELLEAYSEVKQQLEEKHEIELKPEKMIQEKMAEGVMQAVKDVGVDGIMSEIETLKVETVKVLSQMSGKLEAEVMKLNNIRAAINIKEKELKEIYEIDKAASTLAALIEAQDIERRKFEAEMAEEKENLEKEIEETRQFWKQEKEKYQAELKERNMLEQKKRDRDNEEYIYSFQREQQLARNRFEDEKLKLEAEKASIENEIKAIRENAEKELCQREKAIAEKENEFELLKKISEEYPKEMSAAIDKAVVETTQKLKSEHGFEVSLLKKDFDGQTNVLSAKIESLEKTVKEQAERIQKLSTQLEASYQKIQDVAVKAIEGASKSGNYGGLQQAISSSVEK
jgi:hypothetical protein